MTETERCEVKMRFAEKALQDAQKRLTVCSNAARQKSEELSSAQSAWDNQRNAIVSALGSLEQEREKLRQEHQVASEIHETMKAEHLREIAKVEARAKGLKVA